LSTFFSTALSPLLAAPRATLIDLPRLYTDEKFRAPIAAPASWSAPMAASPRSVMRSASGPVIAPPHRQGALRRDFLDQVLGQQLAKYLAGPAALEGGTRFNAAVLALRGGGQQHQLGIGEFHRDSPFGWRASRAVTTEAPQWPGSRRGRIPKSESAQSGAHSDALFAAEIQFFLDHLVAESRQR
jgi:hypothetical protein